MESERLEWTRTAEAAEHGLELIPKSRLLLFMAGYARSRLGKELLTGLRRENAEKELLEAQILLEHALEEPASLDVRGRELNTDIYRALVLNCESRNDSKGLRYNFNKWRAEYPNDPDFKSEWDRLSRKLGL